ALFFIRWDNQNGQLNGSMNYYVSSTNSSSPSFDGTYDYNNHTVTLHIHQTSQSNPVTITANIDGDTITFHEASTTSTTNPDVAFHKASQQDFDNAKKNLNSSS